MKGQFFIISTVIMISAMILITQYLYDYNKVDLSKVEEMQELNYIDDVKASLTNTVRISCSPSNDVLLQKNLYLAEEQLKDSFINKGISFSLTRSGTCAKMDFQFTLKTSDFKIDNTFSV